VVRELKKNPHPRVTSALVVMELRGDEARGAWASATGQAPEVALFGTRGEGKTWDALAAFVLHALLHAAAGAARGSCTTINTSPCLSLMACSGQPWT
jgi:hypothetical protein